jgi:hypothetical protein
MTCLLYSEKVLGINETNETTALAHRAKILALLNPQHHTGCLINASH